MSFARSRVILNASFNMLGMLAQVVSVFIVSPILIRHLGDARYGVWALVESILAYLTLFDLGIGAAVVRYVARFDGKADQQSIDRTFNASLCLFSLAGLFVIAVAAIILGPAWPMIPVPAALQTDAWWLLALLSLNFGIGLPLGVFAAVLDGLQRYGAKTLTRTALLVVSSAVMAIGVTRGGGLLYVAGTITVATLAEHVLFAILVYRYLPRLRFSPRLVDKASMGMILGYSFDAFVALVAGRLSFQTDSIVIGSRLPMSQVTFFAIPARLTEQVKSALRSLTTVVTPYVSQCEGQNDTDAIRRLFLQGTRYVLWLIVPVQLGMWTLGKPFLSLWLGAGYAERCYPTLVILSAPLALTLSQSISGRILYGIGKLRSFSRMLLIEAMCNLGLSLLLVGDYGIEGVAIGTAIPNLILNAALAVYTCSTLQVGLGAYVKRGILAPCALGAIPVMVWMGWDRLFAIHSWPAFIGAGAAGTLCYAVVALLVEPGAWRLREFAVRKLANVGHTPLWRQPVDSY